MPETEHRLLWFALVVRVQETRRAVRADEGVGSIGEVNLASKAAG